MNEIKTCLVTDNHYPRMLKELSDAPDTIFYRGDINILNQYKSIAIIGSRDCSKKGLQLAYETAKMAVEKGLIVVNGLALGCDSEALKGALVKKGRCVAVMPSGLEQVQPKSNEYLANEILENGGCLISEYPPGTPLQKYNYVKRDRIQSGICEGVIIVEAQEKSGTMHTADFALRQKKRLACYAAKLTEAATGNRYLEHTNKAMVLDNLSMVEKFLDSIMNEPVYTQMRLDI